MPPPVSLALGAAASDFAREMHRSRHRRSRHRVRLNTELVQRWKVRQLNLDIIFGPFPTRFLPSLLSRCHAPYAVHLLVLPGCIDACDLTVWLIRVLRSLIPSPRPIFLSMAATW